MDGTGGVVVLVLFGLFGFAASGYHLFMLYFHLKRWLIFGFAFVCFYHIFQQKILTGDTFLQLFLYFVYIIFH